MIRIIPVRNRDMILLQTSERITSEYGRSVVESFERRLPAGVRAVLVGPEVEVTILQGGPPEYHITSAPLADNILHDDNHFSYDNAVDLTDVGHNITFEPKPSDARPWWAWWRK